MFLTKLVASLAFVAPLVSALTIETPSGWQSSSEVTISWSAVQGDPQVFSIELINEVFNRQFALANNIPTGAMTMNVTLPVVPEGDGYTLQFVEINNLTDVFTESAPFSIGPPPETTSESGSTSGSGTASGTTTATATTGSITSSAATTQTTGDAENTATNTDSAAAGGSTSFDNGAITLGLSNTNLAVMAVAAVAGASLVGL